MNAERRRALGIPVHESDAEHTFVDGYCTCGASEPARQRGKKTHRTVYDGTHRYAVDGGRRPRSNLDTIEGNPSGSRA